MRTAHGPTSSGPPSPSSINTAARWVYRLQLNLFAIVLIAVKRVPKYRHPRSSLWVFEQFLDSLELVLIFQILFRICQITTVCIFVFCFGLFVKIFFNISSKKCVDKIKSITNFIFRVVLNNVGGTKTKAGQRTAEKVSPVLEKTVQIFLPMD